MTVSVIIPCFNHSQYLAECLRSVVNQTMKDWEAIVVDDGSRDKEVIKEIVTDFQDPRIKLFSHEENRGLAATRNTGMRAAKCEFVLPLDADDKLAPNYIEKVLPVLLEHPEYSGAFPDFCTFGNYERLMTFEIHDVRTMLQRQWIPGSGTLLRRILWEQLGGYCEAEEFRTGNEDWDFWLGAIERGLQVGHVPETLYYYRRYSESMMTRLAYSDYRTRRLMYKRHRRLFDSYGMARAFLAEGYANSAQSSLERGKRLRTAYLAAQTLRFPTERLHALKLLTKATMPTFAVQLLGKVMQQLLNLKHSVNLKVYKHLYGFVLVRKMYWDRQAKDIDRLWGQSRDDYEVLREVITSTAAKRILDIGCGTGRLLPLYDALGIMEVIGQDISENALQIASNRFNYLNVQLLNVSIEELDFPHSYFDLVISNRVLQHIPRGSIERTVLKICRLGSFIYINESSVTDGKPENYYVFHHDYSRLFGRYGCSVKTQGRMGRQNWFLFERRK